MAGLAALFIAAGIATPRAKSSGLTITFPARIAAGPDYATDVLRDPWDMSNVEDISPYPGDTQGWASFSVSGGQAGGTTSTSAGAGVGFLNPGFYGIINAGKNGVNFPIDTSRFTKMSVRLSDSGSVGEDPRVYYFPDPSTPNPAFGVTYLPKTHNGYNILVKDLTQPQADGVAWTSAPQMRGFRIDPNSELSGVSMFFDWIRITCNDNTPCAAMQTISWSGGSGNANIDVIDHVSPNPTTLRIAAGVTGTSFNWNSGILPPGVYTLKVTRTDGSFNQQDFTINTPPTIAVTDPSRTTGADFATTVLGNPWDMSQSSDIAATSNITNVSFSGGVMNGTNTNGDPGVDLLDNNNNAGQTKVIDTSKYRYFTYRYQVDGGFDLAQGSVARFFWTPVGGADANVTTSKDIVVYDGMNSYTVDLATLAPTDTGGLEQTSTAQTWTAANKRVLRFDPHEFPSAHPFHLDDFKLTAMPQSTGTYTIKWTGSDADADPTVVTLYYDTDQNPLNGKTQIVTNLPIANGSYAWDATNVPLGTYYIYAEANDGLNVSGAYGDAPIVRVTPPCVFSILPATASASHGGGTGTVALTASAPGCAWTATSGASFLTITSGASGTGNGTVAYSVAPNPNRTARQGTLTIAGQIFTLTERGVAKTGDFDGDAHADYVTFTPGSGNWSAPAQSPHQFGLPGDIPVPGDYDGDGLIDRAVFRPNGGMWFIDGQGSVQYGLAGDLPVPADYNGDGATDIAIYRRANGGGTWYVRGQSAIAFGLAFDIPVPADYDGDGKADLAVFRPSTGTWYIALSSTNFSSVSTFQFGLTNDIPVPGDFDGDHKADLAVYRPATSTWYILFSGAGYSTSTSLTLGVLGDAPLAADFTGDGIDDPTVFRASDATFRTYDLAAQTLSTLQQGAPADIPALQRPRPPVVATTDFDGDGRSDVALFRPGVANWYIRNSSSDYSGTQTLQWGLQGDIAVRGDFDGDHKTDTAVWRPSDGNWYLKLSGSGFTTTRTIQWGLQGDVPVPADYDGDGRTDIAIYRPSTGDWYVRPSSTDYTTYYAVHWGGPGDTPVPADYDGDGRADIAIFRTSTGEWWMDTSSAPASVRQWGLGTDVPVTGDFDGDGRADLTIFRPSTGQWLGVDAATGRTVISRQWGLNGDLPLPHDYDGDGISDTAVFRPSTAEWFIMPSSKNGSSSIYLQWGFGGSSDQPLIRAGGQ